jgi:hypothetical protein
VQQLIDMRKKHPALTHGAVTPIYSTTATGAHRDTGIFAFERAVPGDETALVVLNASNQTSDSCGDTGTCARTSFPPGTMLTDVMPGTDNMTFTVKADGTIDVTVPARSGRVLVKK